MTQIKRILLVVLWATSLLISTSVGFAYNRSFFDLQYHYERAIIKLPNGEVIDGPVETWRDFDKDNHVQIKINGVVYLVDKVNVALIHVEG